MTKYDLEIGENRSTSFCHCCGLESWIGHGFVYKNDDAYAVYYAGWSNAHSEKKVTFAIAIGEWDDDSTSRDRACFGIEAYEAEESILFRVIGPENSPWPRTDLLGEMLSRDESLSHKLLREVFSVAEEVIRNHAAIRDYLGVEHELHE